MLAYVMKRGGQSFPCRPVSVITGGLLILALLLFAACAERDDVDKGDKKTSAPASTSPVASEAPKGLIKADPNPVPAGPGPLGTTKISWNTVTDMGPVKIFVSANGEPESPFSGGEKEGSQEAPWIQATGQYDFRLYVGLGADRKLIDHVIVTRNK